MEYNIFEFAGYYLDQMNNPVTFNVTDGQFRVTEVWDKTTWDYVSNRFTPIEDE